MTPEEIKLEERKVKNLEKIANSLDSLFVCLEEIDKADWDKRIQFYLSEWRRIATKDEEEKEVKQTKNK